MCWRKQLLRWSAAHVYLVEGNPGKGVLASAISGVSARGPPKTARMYLDACSLSQPGASIGRVKKEGDAYMQGGSLSQTCFVGSLGRGEAISTDHGRSVAFVAIQKNPSGSFSTPGRETETQKGVIKGGLTRAKGGEGSWKRLTKS